LSYHGEKRESRLPKRRFTVEPPKSEIKISEITTWKKLLGVFLAVVEGLLGFWFYQAESGVERSVAGLCMMVLLLGFLYVVLRVEINAQQVKAVPQDLGKVTPGSGSPIPRICRWTGPLLSDRSSAGRLDHGRDDLCRLGDAGNGCERGKER
jgi:hypothetical protein